MTFIASDLADHTALADTGTIRELAELSRALVLLRNEFQERFGVSIPECTLRLLSESELDEDLKNTRDPMRRYQLVALASETEIAFNPYSNVIYRMKFLAHELGHCTLSSIGFEPEAYGEDGTMGPRRVYHEEVANYFGRQGEDILRANGFLGGRFATFLAKLDIGEKLDRLLEGSVIAKLLKNESVTIADILVRPNEVLGAYPERFEPRPY